MFKIRNICACATLNFSLMHTIYKFPDMIIVGNLHWGDHLHSFLPPFYGATGLFKKWAQGKGCKNFFKMRRDHQIVSFCWECTHLRMGIDKRGGIRPPKNYALKNGIYRGCYEYGLISFPRNSYLVSNLLFNMLTSTQAMNLKFGSYKFGSSVQFPDQNKSQSCWNCWPTSFFKEHPKCSFQINIMARSL